MIDLQLLRDPGYVRQLQEAADAKGMDFDADALAAAFSRRRLLAGQLDDARARQKKLGRDGGKQAAAEVRSLRDQLREAEQHLTALALRAPGIPDARSPRGAGEEDNEVIRVIGQPRMMAGGMTDHAAIALRLGMTDFERAQKFAGSRSYALTGTGALLARAVLDLALDMLIARGFTPVLPPVLVREEAMTGTGYFPLGTDDAYKTDREDRYLTGTSEVSLVSLHRDEILQQLPVRYAGLSSCFRREAGAYGRDVHGLYRVHQFDKVEQVSIIAADDDTSFAEQHSLLNNSEAVLTALELPYRVAIACTGETGQGQRLKYEVETWMPSREAYCETHSCSAFGDFQGRRSNIRYRTENGLAFAFTLNNTAVAVPRILIPLLEHHQQDDGSVRVPVPLRPYLAGAESIYPGMPLAALIR